MANMTAEIITLCMRISQLASELYAGLSKHARDGELAGFWEDMSREELEYGLFWEELLMLVEDGMAEDVFDDPTGVRDDLTAIEGKVRSLHAARDIMKRTSDSFILAYRLEFSLLHPAFERLFHFVSTLSSVQKDPEAQYELHINRLIGACEHHGIGTPEIQLLGETIKRLWVENKRLALQGDMDSLTGLYNRRGLFRMIHTLGYLAERNGHNVGVMMLDIDNFKRINDTHGHQAGDRAIALVGRVLRETMRSSDTPGRYGGEEFLAFFPGVSDGAFKGVAEKLRVRIAEASSSGPIAFTVSVGCAQGLLEGPVPRAMDALIARADKALYEAKHSGKNRVVMG